MRRVRGEHGVRLIYLLSLHRVRLTLDRRPDSEGDFVIETSVQSAALSRRNVLLQMSGVERSDYRCMAVRMRQRVSQDHIGRGHSGRKYLIESRGGVEINDGLRCRLSARPASPDPASNDNPRAGRRCARDRVVMLRLQAGIWDLERVEDAHRNEIVDIRYCRRNADMLDATAGFHGQQRLQQRPNAIGRHQRIMQLPDINMVGLHSLETLVDVSQIRVAVVNVGYVAFVSRDRRYDATALRRQIEFLAARRNELADGLFGDAVATRDVDEIDPAIQYGIENRVRFRVGYGSSVPDLRATEFHRAESQLGNP